MGNLLEAVFRNGKKQIEARTAELSLPAHIDVRGYKVPRLTMGNYLVAMEALQSLPGEIIADCFPGQGWDGLLEMLMNIDEAGVQTALGNLMLSAPKHAIKLASAMTLIDEERLLNDPNIGLDGLVELLTAWAEVNRLKDFPKAVRELIGGFRTAMGGNSPKRASGSKGI